MRDIITSQVTDHLKSKILSRQKKWTNWILGQAECNDWYCERNFGLRCYVDYFGTRGYDYGSSEGPAKT